MKILKKILLGVLILILAITFAIFMSAYFTYLHAKSQISIKDLNKVVREISPDYINIDEISPYLLDATYAIEDRRFYEREGIDYRAIGRAMMQNLKAGAFVEGGSTIDQQLVKIVYFGYKRDIICKLSEFFFVKEINEEYTKDEILEMYVNVINYGDGFIGISQAAKGYFNKEAKELSLVEASLLAGIPKSPSYYQISNDNIETYKRQIKVINDMLEINKISKDEYYECNKIIEKNIHNIKKVKKIIKAKNVVRIS